MGIWQRHFWDFSVSWSFSKNFLNSLTAVRVQAYSRKVLSGIATAFVPRTSWSYTGSCLQSLSDGLGPMVVSRCQQTAQHLMQIGRASLNTSITWGQWCLHRHPATTMSSSTSKLQVINSASLFFGLLFQKKRKERAGTITMFSHCTPCLWYSNWLFNCQLSSKCTTFESNFKICYCYLYLMSSSALDAAGSLA